MKNENINLSVCVATKEREIYINNFIKIITSLICNKTEIVVVDGSKSYNSSLEKIVSSNSNIILKYIHNKNDTGLDKAYDDAVKHSSGKYCWLATDDDEPEKFFFKLVEKTLLEKKDLYILNTTIKCYDLIETLQENRLGIFSDIDIIHDEKNRIENRLLQQLSYIACIIILRSHWIKNSSDKYYGSYFSHISNIFNTETNLKIKVISRPLISIRIDNQSWKNNHLRIFHHFWPSMVNMVENKFINLNYDAVIKNVPFRLLLKYYVLNYLDTVDTSSINRRMNIYIYVIKFFPKKFLRKFFLFISYLRSNKILSYKLKRLIK